MQFTILSAFIGCVTGTVFTSEATVVDYGGAVGACGTPIQDTDLSIALPSSQFATSLCGEKITVMALRMGIYYFGRKIGPKSREPHSRDIVSGVFDMCETLVSRDFGARDIGFARDFGARDFGSRDIGVKFDARDFGSRDMGVGRLCLAAPEYCCTNVSRANVSRIELDTNVSPAKVSREANVSRHQCLAHVKNARNNVSRMRLARLWLKLPKVSVKSLTCTTKVSQKVIYTILSVKIINPRLERHTPSPVLAGTTKSVSVVVVDECAEYVDGHVHVTVASFEALAPLSEGAINVTYSL
ncbi:hypothetical protein C8F01DRAFT_1260593 [Mycena amicta]|nr:hypothetical protein C8F01DRAFT_1260593 [Mycena amicta]